MKIYILKTTLVSLFACLLVLTSCNSGEKSNIESTSEKEVETTTVTPSEPQTVSADTAAKAASPSLANVSLEVGEKLYTGNCVACHSLTTEKLIGPGLAGINERRPQEWLIPWIRNSQKVIESGDKYAVELFNTYNKIPMPSYDFTDDEIKSILAYIDTKSQK